MSYMDILKHINWIDILAIIVTLRISYVSFREGLTHEILPLIGTVLVMVFSLHYYNTLGETISQNLFGMPIQLANFLSFLILAICTWLVFRLLNALVNKIVNVQWHPIIEKFGGLVAGVARAFVTTSLILIILALAPLPYFQWSIRDRSVTGMYFLRIGPSIYSGVSKYFPSVKIGGPLLSAEEMVNKLVSDKLISPNVNKEAKKIPKK